MGFGSRGKLFASFGPTKFVCIDSHCGTRGRPGTASAPQSSSASSRRDSRRSISGRFDPTKFVCNRFVVGHCPNTSGLRPHNGSSLMRADIGENQTAWLRPHNGSSATGFSAKLALLVSQLRPHVGSSETAVCVSNTQASTPQWFVCKLRPHEGLAINIKYRSVASSTFSNLGRPGWPVHRTPRRYACRQKHRQRPLTQPLGSV